MEKKSVKESLLSYMYNGIGISKLYEEDEPKGPAEGPKKVENDPDKNAENPDLTDIMGSHNSILFLTAPDKSGIIKRGGNLGFIELTPDIVEKSGLDVDLEDFQWYCPANEFEAYLKKTGRKYNKNSGEWTSESEETEEEKKERKISTYSDFLNEKEKSEQLNEFTGIPFLGNAGTNVTGKGMEWEGDDPDFQQGKLTDTQRRLVRFMFTRNHLRNSGKMEKELDLTKLKTGDKIEIFVTAFDAETGKSDDKSMVSILFEVDAVILSQGDIEVPMVAGKITQLSPNLGSEDGGFTGVLEAVVENVGSIWDKLSEALDTTTGKIFGGLAALSGMQQAGIITGIAFARYFHSWRKTSLINSGKYTVGTIGKIKNLAKTKAGNFLKYPFTKGGLIKDIKNIKGPLSVLKNYRTYRKTAFMRKGKNAFKGWKLARYILFGKKVAKGAKAVVYASKGARILGGIAKWSNPIGWGLLAVDAVGSFMNYTSDNQAPSWAPIVGGEGDSMKDYVATICPNAKNSFNPADVEVGQTITLCWTQNPESGFALAFSFVMSNSTRTTMNLTKISDFKNAGKLSMFIVNSVNYNALWDKMKTYDLRFLFIKNGTYEEGWSDDNIGAFFLGAKSNPDSKDGVLPISYYGHCDPVVFIAESKAMKDQLVVVDESAPDTFNFYFEDSESNIINVTGSKITNEDLRNASEKEIKSFFEVEPVSSYIGNPDEETEEEREERESLDNSAKSLLAPSDGTEEEKSPDSPENIELASNENYKWYSTIEESKPITSFSEFKSIKESLLFEDDKKPPIEGGILKPGVEELPTEIGGEEEKPGLEDIKGTSLGSQILTAKQMNENFERVLDTIEEPMGFAIYFVENREYADPELRDVYQPGSFMNFTVDASAIKASEGADIEGDVLVNNLDLLLDVKKGVYNFSKKDTETKLKDEDLGGDDSKSSKTILTANISSARDKEEVAPLSSGRGEKEEIKTTIERISPDQLSQLDISDWEDITSIKIIRDGSGNAETIKIKNRKAKFGDKSRKIEKGEPGWETALALAKANNDRESEEEQLELAKR
jgi:hypothetical protein